MGEQEASGHDAATPVRVIVADDDPQARNLVRAMIGGEDSLVLVGEARDAEEAVAMAVEAQPDVAILDWMMPKGGGSTAARGISERCPGVALVALTSSETEEAAIDMLRAGATSFLIKGGSQKELARTLHRAAGT